MRKISIFTLKGYQFTKEALSVAWVVDDAEGGVIYCKDLAGKEVAVPMTAVHYLLDIGEVD